MAERRDPHRILLIGVGNTLMQDDGIGVHVARAIAADATLAPVITCVDGGTIGLALLPELEDSALLILVDASELNANPGHIAVFHDREIDRQLSNKRRSVHEVALTDLLSAAAIRGRLPQRRVLVAIQPQSTDWGLDLTAPVKAAMPAVLKTIREITLVWLDEAA